MYFYIQFLTNGPARKYIKFIFFPYHYFIIYKDSTEFSVVFISW